MDRLQQMELFVRVAELGSFSEAARRLGLSKGAVSKGVAELEERLGARLLHRTTRQRRLSDEGERFLERCQGILEEVAASEAEVGRLNQEPRGGLRVSAPMSFTPHLAPAMAEFLRRHPAIRLDLVLNDRFVDLIEEGFDVAVRIGRLADSPLMARKLAVVRVAACAAPEYLARHGLPASPAEIPEPHRLLYGLHQLEGAWRPFSAAAFGPEGRLRANNGEVLRAAALQGMGVGLFPTFLVGEDLRLGRLVPVLPDFPLPESGLYAVYPPNRQLAARVRVFIHFLAEYFGGTPPWER
ncbi:MAG: LysR family transcriptional regulator [Magnetococcales bacterium]|nr:LysR family transcriptional regulator [Magnetococcales bacterium]